jgi:NAD(P)-dependent dehydrogenase (short-subunit alcohol dehydrogenase family)
MAIGTGKINESSVFLVSGGGRGVTAQCVIRLAETYPCKLILLGRSAIHEPLPAYSEGCFDDAELKKRIMQDLIAQGEKPTPVKLQKIAGSINARRDILQTLTTLRNLGREVAYVNADVTNLEALRSQLMPAIAQLGAVTGIIHGAGNLADKLIENKTEQDFELVYTTKVQGLENLFQCVPPGQLSHLVLFSSVAGFYGSGGQSDYAIANEILNKSALLVKQHHPQCHVAAINWGPWDSGMVTPILKQAFMERDIDIIPLDVGASRLVEELSDRHQNTAIVVIGSPLVPEPGTLDSTLQTHRIRRRLTLAANPFLQDYTIAGLPTLPVTCALSWMINTCEQLYPGYKCSVLEQFKVLKPLVLDGTQSGEFVEEFVEEFVVEAQEVAKPTAQSVVFEVRISNAHGNLYYSSQVSLQPRLQQPPIAPVHPQVPAAIAEPDQLSGATLYADRTLPQGAAFQGLQHILCHSSHLTAHAVLPPLTAPIQGQFFGGRFNPFTADLMMQSLQLWAKQPQPMPIEIQQLACFEPLPCGQPFAIEVRRAEADTLTVTAYDADQVYWQMSGVRLAATISAPTSAAPETAPPPAPLLSYPI